ncbi:nucleotidyltransferase domain-containing protein [Hydrogenimonas sp.]
MVGLFGSYARGEAGKFSDIDIAYFAPRGGAFLGCV